MAHTEREQLIQAVAVTAELLGTELTDAAAKVVVDDLSAYPLAQVFASLQRCRREVKGRLTLSEIISRLDDGRPGVEEAWAMIPKDEADSVVWTAEMRTAYGAAHRLLQSGDEIAARMAFKETYQAEITKARAEQRDPQWEVSLGYNHGDRKDAHAGRRAALAEAVDRQRITHEVATAILPDYREAAEPEAPRLEGPKRPTDVLPRIEQMRAALSEDDAA